MNDAAAADPLTAGQTTLRAGQGLAPAASAWSGERVAAIGFFGADGCKTAGGFLAAVKTKWRKEDVILRSIIAHLSWRTAMHSPADHLSRAVREGAAGSCIDCNITINC
jgi:hypothetical protein